MNLKTFAAALAATAISGSAFAADLPSRKVAPAYVAPAPVFTWTGFYLGLNAGASFGAKSGLVADPLYIDQTFATSPAAFIGYATSFGNNGGGKTGFLLGGQIGWNYQLSSALVAGIEADIQGVLGGGGGSTVGVGVLPPPAGAGFTFTTVNSAANRVDWLGTLRARAGFLATPGFLLYATGGLAYGGVKQFSTLSFLNPAVLPTPSGAVSGGSSVRIGYAVGAGGEWKFAPAWSLKVEYLYYNLGRSGSATTTLLDAAAANGTRFIAKVRPGHDADGHIVRAGLNYHFGAAAAPVVAKY